MKKIIIAFIALWLILSAGIFITMRYVQKYGIKSIVTTVWEGEKK